MEQEEKNIDLIEAFAKGKLTGSELADFERRRATDIEFASEVADYLLIMKEIRTSQEKAFNNKLRGWENEIARQQSKDNVIPMRRILSIAATILIIALAGGYTILRLLPVQENEALFAKHFQPYEDVISERSGKPDSLQQGMSLYNQGKYSEAIPYLEMHLNKNLDEAGAKLYLGISYLADNKANKAKDLFESLIRDEQGLYKEIAQWNLVLIYLKTNETSELKRSLQEIIRQKDHLYAAEAISLYEEI